MDPLSGLAIAGATVQFIDFGVKVTTKFVTKSHDLYRLMQSFEDEKALMDYSDKAWQSVKDGWKSAERVLEADAQQLQLLSGELRYPLGEDAPESDDAGLVALCRGCDSIAQEMLAYLQSLKVSFPRFRQVEKASKSESKSGRATIAMFREEKRQLLTKMEIFKKAIKATVTEDRMKEIQSRLATLRQSLELYILVDIK